MFTNGLASVSVYWTPFFPRLSRFGHKVDRSAAISALTAGRILLDTPMTENCVFRDLIFSRNVINEIISFMCVFLAYLRHLCMKFIRDCDLF